MKTSFPSRALFWSIVIALPGPAGLAAQSPPTFALPAWETEHAFADIPHPREVFGFEPGEDYRLATYAQILEYFRVLDAASDRVHVEEIGTSVLGHPLILAYISSARNIANLDEIRATSERLARARVTEPEARESAAQGKTVVWIDGGLHATEVAGAQHTPLLAYRVAGEETPEMRRIRDHVVLLLMPVMNPDGLEIVVDWTARSRGRAWEGSPPPVLYHFYTGHDNNRDWFMLTQPESRAVAEVLYDRWYPQIVYNQHQSAPEPTRIFIPPFSDPVNPHIQPLVIRGVNAVGNAMGQRFSEEGKTGAVSGVSFDMWWNGGMRTTPYFHNMIGILTETAHADVAPRYTAPESLPEYVRGSVRARIPNVLYPDPWPGGWFRLRDAVEYMITGALATLDIASRDREDWLFNIWRMGRNAIEAGEAGAPFAYLVPPDQRNPREAVALLNVLRRGGVEVDRAVRPFTAGGQTYSTGTYVVRAAQAFRPHLMDLLEPQRYPDTRLYPGGPPDTPYDVSGWTLPIQMGVRVVRVDAPFPTDDMVVAENAEVWPGRITGNGRWGWVVSPRSNAATLAINRLVAAGASVSLAPGGVPDIAEPGSYVVRGIGPERLEPLAAELGVDFNGLDQAPQAPLHPMDRIRVGLYKSWDASSDEGWTRWVLNTYGFPVDTLHDADIRTGDLSRFHAIILPHQRPSTLLHGHDRDTRPPDMTGGLGLDGMLRLQEYARGGGRLIGLDGGARLLIDQLGLPVRNTVEGLPPEEFFVPGSLIRANVHTEHILAAGVPSEISTSFVRSSAFSDGEGVETIVRYADTDLLLSGWALGEDQHLAGRAALIRVPFGAGDVVLFGFRPQFRGQPRDTFKLLFNALHGAAAGVHRRESSGG